MREVLADVRRGSPLLWRAGLLHFGIAAVLLVLMPFDELAILGVDRWLKPFKFAVSIGLWIWTVAWMLAQLAGGGGRSGRILARGVALTMVGETAAITSQAARGVTSHFNAATDYDAVVFSVMGGLILLNTLLAGWLLGLFLVRRATARREVVAGIRLGLVVFLVGSAVGVALVVHGAHTVGAPDGGPGLPLVNWSTRAGDLRVAHALGLHGPQVFPALGALLAGRRNATLWLGGAALTWLALLAWTWVEAANGRPLVALG